MATTTLGRLKGRTIQVDEYGRVYCDCMGWAPGVHYEPCQHVFSALRLRMDAQATLGTTVLVPLYTEQVDGVYLVIEVTVKHTERRGSMSPFYLGDNLVGWLDEGEGRWAMRPVLLEFIRSQYYDAPACASPKHSNYLLSPKERVRLDLNSASKTVIAGLASVLANGECWRCLHSVNDDLVPEI